MTVYATTRLFRSGNSEAVRLPKEIAFGRDVEVMLERDGDVVTMRLVTDAATEKRRLLDMLADLQAIGAPRAPEVREPIEFPERDGL